MPDAHDGGSERGLRGHEDGAGAPIHLVQVVEQIQPRLGPEVDVEQEHVEGLDLVDFFAG